MIETDDAVATTRRSAGPEASRAKRVFGACPPCAEACHHLHVDQVGWHPMLPGIMEPQMRPSSHGAHRQENANITLVADPCPPWRTPRTRDLPTRAAPHRRRSAGRTGTQLDEWLRHYPTSGLYTGALEHSPEWRSPARPEGRRMADTVQHPPRAKRSRHRAAQLPRPLALCTPARAGCEPGRPSTGVFCAAAPGTTSQGSSASATATGTTRTTTTMAGSNWPVLLHAVAGWITVSLGAPTGSSGAAMKSGRDSASWRAAPVPAAMRWAPACQMRPGNSETTETSAGCARRSSDTTAASYRRTRPEAAYPRDAT
jgi:hypothetical protein